MSLALKLSGCRHVNEKNLLKKIMCGRGFDSYLAVYDVVVNVVSVLTRSRLSCPRAYISQMAGWLVDEPFQQGWRTATSPTNSVKVM